MKIEIAPEHYPKIKELFPYVEIADWEIPFHSRTQQNEYSFALRCCKLYNKPYPLLSEKEKEKWHPRRLYHIPIFVKHDSKIYTRFLKLCKITGKTYEQLTPEEIAYCNRDVGTKWEIPLSKKEKGYNSAMGICKRWNLPYGEAIKKEVEMLEEKKKKLLNGSKATLISGEPLVLQNDKKVILSQVNPVKSDPEPQGQKHICLNCGDPVSDDDFYYGEGTGLCMMCWENQPLKKPEVKAPDIIPVVIPEPQPVKIDLIEKGKKVIQVKNDNGSKKLNGKGTVIDSRIGLSRVRDIGGKNYWIPNECLQTESISRVVADGK